MIDFRHFFFFRFLLNTLYIFFRRITQNVYPHTSYSNPYTNISIFILHFHTRVPTHIICLHFLNKKKFNVRDLRICEENLKWKLNSDEHRFFFILLIRQTKENLMPSQKASSSSKQGGEYQLWYIEWYVRVYSNSYSNSWVLKEKNCKIPQATDRANFHQIHIFHRDLELVIASKFARTLWSSTI